MRFRGRDGQERSRTFRTRKEAERYERSQHDALDRGVWVDPRSGKVTLAAWAREWQRTVVHLRPSTTRIYDANLRNHVIPELGDTELGKLTPSMFRGWLAGLLVKKGSHGETLSKGSVAQAYRTLNNVLNAAVDNELLGRNPLAGIKAPRSDADPMRFLSHEEVASLAAAIDPRYRAMVLVASYTGLRAGELMALRRTNIDLLHRTITVVEQVQVFGGAPRGEHAEDGRRPAILAGFGNDSGGGGPCELRPADTSSTPSEPTSICPVTSLERSTSRARVRVPTSRCSAAAVSTIGPT